MSKLAYFGRPWVVFDANNKEHRRWFAEFNRSHSWGGCPVRFVVSEDQGDLVTMIQRALIQFYLDKEFGTELDPRVRTKPGVVKKQHLNG